MAKHNNTDIYNYDSPTLRTGLLGFRPSNAKRTRNYSVSDIASLIIQQLGLAYGNAIISGSVVWDEGLQYTATNLLYIIEGTIYEAPNTTVTLSDADPTLSRIDVIYADTDGNVGVLEGQPAVDPLQPVIDNTSQVMYTFVLIGPGATEPTGVGEDIIYSDNLVTDWDNATSNEEEVDFDNTLYINSGTKNIFAKVFYPSDTITFTSDTVIDFNTVSSLNFRIRKLDTEDTEIRIYFINENGDFSSSINLSTGNYGFDGSNTSSYQNINLPKTLFTGITDVKQLVFFNSSSEKLSFALDDIRLVTGVYNPPSFGNFLNLLDTPDTYSTHAGKYVKVNASEDGLEFVEDPGEHPTENVYDDIAAMLGDQGNQTQEFRQKVLDASADPEVSSGRAYYIKQTSSTANLTADYTRISEADALAIDASQGLVTEDCGSVIPLDTVFGHFCNMESPNGNTMFAINNLNLIGSYTVVRINVSQTDLDNDALTEPSVSGATQKGGIAFQADTDLDLLVQNRGVGLFYSFLPTGINVSPLVSNSNLYIVIDADDDSTDATFYVCKHGISFPLFRVQENGEAKFGYLENLRGKVTVLGDDSTGGIVDIYNSTTQLGEVRDYTIETLNGNLIIKANGGSNGSSTPVFTVNSSTLQTGFGNYEFPRPDGSSGEGFITDGSGNMSWVKLQQIIVTTFASLPTGVTGMTATITDASSISYRAVASGGGSDTALVFYDGTNWIYH